jgi:hypothetical protein
MSAAVCDAVDNGDEHGEQRHATQQDHKTCHDLLLPSSATLATTNVIQIPSPRIATVVENGSSRCFAFNSIIVISARRRDRTRYADPR